MRAPGIRPATGSSGSVVAAPALGATAGVEEDERGVAEPRADLVGGDQCRLSRTRWASNVAAPGFGRPALHARPVVGAEVERAGRRRGRGGAGATSSGPPSRCRSSIGEDERESAPIAGGAWKAAAELLRASGSGCRPPTAGVRPQDCRQVVAPDARCAGTPAMMAGVEELPVVARRSAGQESSSERAARGNGEHRARRRSGIAARAAPPAHASASSRPTRSRPGPTRRASRRGHPGGERRAGRPRGSLGGPVRLVQAGRRARRRTEVAAPLSRSRAAERGARPRSRPRRRACTVAGSVPARRRRWTSARAGTMRDRGERASSRRAATIRRSEAQGEAAEERGAEVVGVRLERRGRPRDSSVRGSRRARAATSPRAIAAAEEPRPRSSGIAVREPRTACRPGRRGGRTRARRGSSPSRGKLCLHPSPATADAGPRRSPRARSKAPRARPRPRRSAAPRFAEVAGARTIMRGPRRSRRDLRRPGRAVARTGRLLRVVPSRPWPVIVTTIAATGDGAASSPPRARRRRTARRRGPPWSASSRHAARRAPSSVTAHGTRAPRPQALAACTRVTGAPIRIAEARVVCGCARRLDRVRSAASRSRAPRAPGRQRGRVAAAAVGEHANASGAAHRAIPMDL